MPYDVTINIRAMKKIIFRRIFFWRLVTLLFVLGTINLALRRTRKKVRITATGIYSEYGNGKFEKKEKPSDAAISRKSAIVLCFMDHQ